MSLFFSSVCFLWPSSLLRRLAVTSLNFIEIIPDYPDKICLASLKNSL